LPTDFDDPSDVDDPMAGKNIDLKTVAGVEGLTPFESAIENARFGSNAGFPGDPSGKTIAAGPEFSWTVGKRLTGDMLRSARAIQCSDQNGANYYAWVTQQSEEKWDYENKANVYWSREGKFLNASLAGTTYSMNPGFVASMLDPTNMAAGKLATWWLRAGIVRSGVQSFVFRSIAQDPEQLAQWTLSLRTLAANTDSWYARTLGRRLVAMEARLAFNEVRAEFFRLRGIAGAGTHNIHHWNALSQFPELALDPRNLFLVESTVENGRRVGGHIFLHWMTRSGNPYTGLLRPGAALDLGWPQSVIKPLEAPIGY
jgi:hypothetical protein